MRRVALRPVEIADLDAIFDQMRDRESVHMAAFTAEDPNDRSAFDAHMEAIMSSSENRIWAITAILVRRHDRQLRLGRSDRGHLLDRPHALGARDRHPGPRLLLEEETPDRPIRARAASDNPGSLRVLRKVGFHPIATEVSFAPGRAAEIEETILELP